MITINNKLREPYTSLFGPDGQFIGMIENALQMNDVRLQIKTEQAEGYYFSMMGQEIYIDKDGNIENWIDGFYDGVTKQLNQLFDL